MLTLLIALISAVTYGSVTASSTASSAAPIAYNAILALVIVELIFAFSVGIICILFSFNLLRALKDSSTDLMSSLPSGALPPSRGSNNLRSPNGSVSGNEAAPTDYSTFHDPNASRVSHTSMDSEMDYEGQIPGYQPPPETLFQTFGGYLKLW